MSKTDRFVGLCDRDDCPGGPTSAYGVAGSWGVFHEDCFVIVSNREDQ